MGEATEPLSLAPHSSRTLNLETMLGRFADASWAYRFGPPAQDLVVASLEAESPDGPRLVSQAVHQPAGRTVAVESAERLGIALRAERRGEREVGLVLRSERFVYGVRAGGPALVPDDDAFHLEPGVERTVKLRALAAVPDAVAITALNLRGRLTADLEG